VLVQSRRDAKMAKHLLRKLLKKQGRQRWSLPPTRSRGHRQVGAGAGMRSWV
jgi:hypothetical protein